MTVTKAQAAAIRRRYYLLYIARKALLKASKAGLFLNVLVFLGLACTIDSPTCDLGITAALAIINTALTAFDFLVYYLLREGK